jgi:hypothetical protein
MSRPCVRVLLAIGIGVLVTLVTCAASFALNGRGFESTGEAVFWPNSLLQYLVPAPNIGTADHPHYEGTRLNFLAFVASFPLAVIFYGLVAYLFLRRLKT